MAYFCSDCSYRGTTSGQVGECPACGSFNIAREKSGLKKVTSHRSKLNLVILVSLWTVLFALIIWKLYR